jgi:hypothetical protein
MATLRPIWDGRDAAGNLARHVELLRNEGLTNILGSLDLGEAWQAEMIPAWLDGGFIPRLILPYAGRGDLLLLQYSGE